MKKIGCAPTMYVGCQLVSSMLCLFDGDVKPGHLCEKQGYSGIRKETNMGIITIPACQKHWDEAMRRWGK